MGADLDELLETIEMTFRARPDNAAGGDPLPDLRERYDEIQPSRRGAPWTRQVLAELDEIVDAADGLAAAAGLEAVVADTPSPTESPTRRPRIPPWLARAWQ